MAKLWVSVFPPILQHWCTHCNALWHHNYLSTPPVWWSFVTQMITGSNWNSCRVSLLPNELTCPSEIVSAYDTFWHFATNLLFFQRKCFICFVICTKWKQCPLKGSDPLPNEPFFYGVCIKDGPWSCTRTLCCTFWPASSKVNRHISSYVSPPPPPSMVSNFQAGNLFSQTMLWGLIWDM